MPNMPAQPQPAGERNGEAVPAATFSSAEAPSPSTGGDQGAPRKKRRRRRGRRGGSGRQHENPLLHHEAMNGEVSHDAGAGLSSAIVRREDSVSVAAPNAASSPVWSLGGDGVVSHPPEPVAEAIEAPRQAAREEREPAAARTAREPAMAGSARASTEPMPPSQPPRKGWWQRTFRGE